MRIALTVFAVTLGFKREVVQTANAAHDAGKGAGNRDLGRVGEVGFAIHAVIMNFVWKALSTAATFR